MRPFKAIALAGLLGITALTTGCNDRKERPADNDLSEQIEKGADRTGDKVKHGSEELKEEVGGSGAGKDGDIGKHPGVINDGEGPLEKNKK